MLGKDFAGTVQAVGEGVTAAHIGDSVFGVLMRDYVGDGTFADYVVVPETIGLAERPAGLELPRAGALGLAGAAAHAAIAAVKPSDGDIVLISGATGGVGAMSVHPGETWDRLAAIKAKYDPTNLFRLNQNVPPAAERTR